jgi:hypothetical protein
VIVFLGIERSSKCSLKIELCDKLRAPQESTLRRAWSAVFEN